MVNVLWRRMGLGEWAGRGHGGPCKSHKGLILKIVGIHGKILIGEALPFLSLRSTAGSSTVSYWRGRGSGIERPLGQAWL